MAREYWVADCETDPFKHGRNPEPFIWGAYNGEDYFEFSTASEFVSFFINKKVVIYAHNGGKFDWHYVLDWLEPGVKVSVINGRLAKFSIGEAEFRDSFSLFPFALSEYKKDTVDYKIFEKEKRDDPHNRDTIRKYLRSDCVYLFDLLSQFFENYGRKFTLPGAALSQWREISGEEPDYSNEKFYNDFAPYYYGGRVECFSKGYKKEKFYVYDINSAYPFAMVHKHPWGLLSFVDNRLPKTTGEIQRSFIDIECRSFGAFPFRSGISLEFPNDQQIRRFHISGWEYLAAIDTGTLDANARILKVTTFADNIDFKDYVTHFYELKARAKVQGNRGEELFAKYLLNGLYGKFASNPDNYSEYLTCLKDEVNARHELDRCNLCEACEVEPKTTCPRSWSFVAELRNVSIISRPLPENSRRYFNVAVGASITGFVRAHLWRAIRAGNVIYCDTDSIATRAPLGRSFLGDNLGAWKSEGEFDAWGVAGKKLYAFEYSEKDFKAAVKKAEKKAGKKLAPDEIEKCKFKIASKGAKLTAAQINDISRGAEILYKQDAPTYSLRRGKQADTQRRIRMT